MSSAQLAAGPPVWPLNWRMDPIALVAAWPIGLPLVCLTSGGVASSRSRWSIFAVPRESVLAQGLSEADRLFDMWADKACACPPLSIPFAGGWIGSIAYEFGREIEPAAGLRPRIPAAEPLIEFHRCPGAFVHDRRTGSWFAVGAPEELPEIDPERAFRGANHDVELLAPPASAMGREDFLAAVARAVEYIRAGDVFQANIAHHLRAAVSGSPRAFAARLLEASGAWYGAYIESFEGDAGLRRAIASASPELFIEFDPTTRRVVTRPIKGTRSAGDTAARQELKACDKDRAELAMIVDLMRNDLGRVCEYGSIAVEDPRSIERHGCSLQRTRGAQREESDGCFKASASRRERHGPFVIDQHRSSVSSVHSVVNNHPGLSGVFHGVATVSGVLRHEHTLTDLLRATFPPGSVTGAPKIRAMQIIEELEPLPRGIYCGAIGYVSRCGRACFNVAIRTATITPASDPGMLDLDFPVGAGIVADSDPAREWAETLHKAGVLMGSLTKCGHRPACTASADRGELT